MNPNKFSNCPTNGSNTIEWHSFSRALNQSTFTNSTNQKKGVARIQTACVIKFFWIDLIIKFFFGLDNYNSLQSCKSMNSHYESTSDHRFWQMLEANSNIISHWKAVYRQYQPQMSERLDLEREQR